MNTQETRLDSHLRINPQSRKAEILNLLGDKELTAREILRKANKHDPNYVRPRLTELVEQGIVEVCGSKFDKLSNRHVVIFRRKNG